MTRINKLVMTGFKSFGKRTELIFGDGYNVILGPNGSGKSNVSDGLCFVLGKGSAKGLRAEKAANLIYNGGKTKKPANFGEVSIFFDNRNNTFPIDTEEIKITRRVKKSGISNYLINDQKSTRQNILELLTSANINPDGYNIIMQGDIVKLIEMSTTNRRLLIEEIAGINIYEDKKQKALKELEKVDAKFNEAQIILSERKTYLHELKKERDQAMKYKDLKDKVDRNKATYLSLMLGQKNKVKEELNKKIDGYKAAIEKESEFISSTRKIINQKKKEILDINREVEQKGEKEQVKLHKEIEKLKIDLATYKSRTESCENEIKRVLERKSQLTKSLEDVDEKISSLKEQNKKTSNEERKVLSEITKINDSIFKFNKKHKMENASSIDQELEKLDKQIDENQKSIEGLRREQQELLRDKDRKEFQINTLDEKISKVLGVSKEHKEEFQKLQQQRKELKKVSMEITQLLSKGSALASQKQMTKVKLDKAQAELQQLQAKNINIQHAVRGDQALEAIVKNKNNFKEVYGVVSELGEVDKKFSVALEVAAGSKLKSVVVDTDKTAAQCINYLKTRRLGVVTFLPLNKIRPVPRKNLGPVLKATGVHGLAIDLVRYDPKFKNFFSYVFGNTIVVESIETARRIGIGKYRMVTLTGDTTEISGAMRGGHRKKQSGFKFQERKVTEKLASSEKNVADLQISLSRLEAERDEIMLNLDDLRQFKSNLEGEVIVKEKSLFLDHTDLDANKQAKQDLQGELKSIDKKINEVQLKISGENRNLAQFKIKKQQLRTKVTELRNPRLLAELNAFQQKKGELREELVRIQGEIKNTQTQIDTIHVPEKENISKIIKQHEKEEKSFTNEKEELQKKITSNTEELKIKEVKQKEFYEKFKEFFKKRESLNKEIQDNEEAIIKTEEVIRGKEHKMNAFSIENAKVKAEIAGLEEEYSRYKDIELFKGKSIQKLKLEINQFERMVENFGNVNMKALEIYEAVEKEYNNLLEKLESLDEERKHVLGMMEEIEAKKKELFLKTYNVINEHFQKMFLTLSTKGSAFLELENPDDPLSAGVGIKVRIVGKKFLDIRSLSGGEKTMTALAFIFSIQEYQPASFYILDEVDAALDKKNSERLAELIRNYADRSQYVVISHNDAVIERGDILYGISMGAHNISKVVSLQG